MVKVEVWGNYGCFTNPIMRSEAYSYDVITPSAARNILDAIYWHPCMKWVVEKIYVCNPVNRITTGFRGAEEQILNNSILTNVRYVIQAHFVMTENRNPSDNEDKIAAIVGERLKHGRCHHQPYFGRKEYVAYFKECTTIPDCPETLKGEIDLGNMFFDYDYENGRTPKCFHCVMKNGVISVPEPNSLELEEGVGTSFLSDTDKMYNTLVSEGKLAKYGFEPNEMTYVIRINPDLSYKVELIKEPTADHKGKLIPVKETMIVPISPTRTSGVDPCFLYDNGKYVYGFDTGSKKGSEENYKAFREKHHQLLDAISNVPGVNTFLNFLDKDIRKDNQFEEIDGRARFVFYIEGVGYIHEIPEVVEVWNTHYNTIRPMNDVCRIHRESVLIGASWVPMCNFNKNSFCSFGREQGNNAPVSNWEEFKYTQVLRYLSKNSKAYAGKDSCILSWTDIKDSDGWDIDIFEYTDSDHREMVRKLANGEKVTFKNIEITASDNFYMLGVKSNGGARAFIQFFYKNTLGQIAKNVVKYYEKMNVEENGEVVYLDVEKVLNLMLAEGQKRDSINDKVVCEFRTALIRGRNIPKTIVSGILNRMSKEKRYTHETAKGYHKTLKRRLTVLNTYYNWED